MDGKIIVIHESKIDSIIKDGVTFGMIALLLLFNHKVLSGSVWVDMVMILFAILVILGRCRSKSVRVFDSREEAKNYINKGVY